MCGCAVVRDERFVEAGGVLGRRCPARPTEAGMLTGVMDRGVVQAPRDGCGWDALFSRRPARRCLVRHKSLIIGSDGGSSHNGPVFGSIFGPDAGPNGRPVGSSRRPPQQHLREEGTWFSRFPPKCFFIGAWSARRRLSGWQLGDSQTSNVTRVLANGCDSRGSHQDGVLPKAFVPAYNAGRKRLCTRWGGAMAREA